MTTLASRLLFRFAALLLLSALTIGCTEADTDADTDAGPSATPTEPSQASSPGPSEPVASGRVPIIAEGGGPVSRDLRRLVRQFVDYAVEQSDGFPLAESVTMFLGGETAKAIDDIAAAISDRRVWRICPAEWEYYGASDCPVDLLSPMAEALVNETTLTYSSAYDDVICAPTRTGPLPKGRLVILRPLAEWRTCATDFALVLSADPAGRLQAIDLTLAAP